MAIANSSAQAATRSTINTAGNCVLGDDLSQLAERMTMITPDLRDQIFNILLGSAAIGLSPQEQARAMVETVENGSDEARAELRRRALAILEVCQRADADSRPAASVQ